MTVRLLAPAKLNLCLTIGARRSDGYHDLETLFERIDLADELTFDVRDGSLEVICEHAELDGGPDNLVTKAARLLQSSAGAKQGAAIHLTKWVPVASGLGGGSSDAATTLIGLNRLWQLGLSTERLCDLGAELGSDVPFFLYQTGFAIGRGRGERCEPLREPLPTLRHVLVVPDQRLSTSQVYQGLDEARARGRFLTASAPLTTMCLHALRNGSLGELAKGMANELEPEAIRRCPVIQEIKANLRDSGCVHALTSGSGSAVFGLCRDLSHAEQVIARLRSKLPTQWLLRVVSTHPESVSLEVPANRPVPSGRGA